MTDYTSGTLATAILNFTRQNATKQIELEELEIYQEMLNDKPDYQEYIKSPEWKTTSNKAKERAGYRCQLCNRKGTYSTLHTHHRTYERLGLEFDDDLIVLCNKCHKKHHDIELHEESIFDEISDFSF